VTRLRTAHGLRLVPTDQGALVAVLRALRRGEVVGFALDRDVAGTGQTTRFLDRRARLSHAPALISRRTGAPVLPASVQRLPTGRFAAQVHSPVWPSDHPSADELTAAILAPIERAVRQTPGQWVMFQPLFEPPSLSTDSKSSS
jgi:KDO2-lipid IV(A) lauroyltransferase